MYTPPKHGRRTHALVNTHTHRVDDIEDNSKLRRGVPVAHSIYGVASTINTANYVYFQARRGEGGGEGRLRLSSLPVLPAAFAVVDTPSLPDSCGVAYRDATITPKF